MADLTLHREFPVSTDVLFAHISDSALLIQWFGPEGIDLTEAKMDFTRTGPWFAIMHGRESGNRFKVSGQVTHVKPPTSVGLTWAWHDEADKRGPESHVTFTVAPTVGGAKLTIAHVDLADAEMVTSHNQGWTSTLNKLESFLSPK